MVASFLLPCDELFFVQSDGRKSIMRAKHLSQSRLRSLFVGSQGLAIALVSKSLRQITESYGRLQSCGVFRRDRLMRALAVKQA